LEILFLSSSPPPALSTPTLESLPSALQFDARCVLLTADRTWLNRVLDYRAEQMVEQGLLQETADLLMDGSLQASSQRPSTDTRRVHLLP
jgi:tRNA A37 N6-isopentenylltransferase MiaA